MKRSFIISIFCLGITSGIFAQKVDFSGYLASSGGVHTSTPSVVDKNGNIFVAGETKSPDFPETFKNAEPDKSWTNCIWKFDLNGN